MPGSSEVLKAIKQVAKQLGQMVLLLRYTNVCNISWWENSWLTKQTSGTKAKCCKYLKIWRLTLPTHMTINEVMHIVIIIRICVCWPMLKSYLWAGWNWAMNLQRNSLFLVTVDSILVVAQIIWFCCRANSGGAAHTIKTCRIYAYSRSASSQNPKVLSTIT